MGRSTSLLCPGSVLAAAVLVSLLAPPSRAEYINLSWDDCGASGVSNKTFACDTNAGAPFALIGSFQPPPGVNQYVAFSGLISLTANSPTLPDWWKHATGECRGTSDLTLSFDYSGNTACTNPYPPGASPVYLLDIGFGGPNKARLRFQGVFLQNPVALDPGVEYYGFKFLVSRSKTVGAGACAGCDTEVDFVLDEFQLFQFFEVGYDPRIMTPGTSNEVTWRGVPNPSAPLVTSLIPAAGAPGSPVEVRGMNFLGTTSVHFGTLEATFSVASDSVIQASVPVAARSGPVFVTSPSGVGSSVINFVVAPVIQSFDPTSGLPGSTVSVHGYNFVGTTSVQIDGVPASFMVESDELIEATVPAAADVGPIRVTNPGGTATSSLDFTRVVGGGTINLSWDDCGGHGTESKAFACNTNTGVPFPLIGSFVPPPAVSEYLGFTAELMLSAPSFPDWWKFGAGECREALALNVSVDFLSGPSSCVDYYQGQGQAGYAYQVGFGGPDRARCVIQGGVPFEQRGPVDHAQEYYAFIARIARSKSTGAGSCSGCNVPVTIVLESIQLIQPGSVGYDPVLTTPGRGTVIWSGELVGVPGLSGSPLALGRAICEQDRRAVAVSLTLPLGTPAKLELFDVSGRVRASRSLDGLGAGSHDVRLAVDRPLSAGVYFVRLAQGDESATRRLTAR